MQYVVDADDASQEMRAQRPLRQAQVEVTEVPGRPGVYRAVAFVRPHFQLDELSVSLRLVAEMPQGKN
jgi:type VI secretion system protein ImpC